jgi:RNA polymerase sigma-70 factor (ECF subfamily)
LTASSPTPAAANELLSDEQLVARTLAGQRQAFNELVVRHERRLFRFLSRTAPNAADVEDAMQHAFLKAFTKLRGYDPRWRFTTWLFTIAVRELRSLHRRGNGGGGPRAVSLDGPGAVDPPAPAARDDEPGDLWALARRVLNPKHYTALWLRYGEDLPARDIARVMGRPRIWVSVTLHRACATLRQAAESSPAGRAASVALSPSSRASQSPSDPPANRLNNRVERTEQGAL